MKDKGGKAVNNKCEHCNNELRPLNPPVEEYLENKFCINLFGWKLLLLKDHIVMGCPDCLADEEQSRRHDEFNDAVSDNITNEIKKGNLVCMDQEAKR